MDAMETILKDMLSELECGICHNYMSDEIPMCYLGHSICKKCKTLCPFCPTCKSGFGQARNYTLEKMLASVKFPCKFRANGCNKEGNAIEIQQHMLECDEGFVACPMDDAQKCVWRGKRHNLKEHFTSNHPGINTNYVYVNLCTVTAFMFEHKAAFKVCRRYLKDLYMQWVVQYIGDPNKAKNYMYKIEYKSDDGHQMTITANCVPIGPYEQAFNCLGITIQKKMFTYYKDTNYLHKFTIIKKNI